jgi:large subunit ribosomal protein L10Ae
VKGTVRYIPLLLFARFQLKKTLVLGTAFGTDELTEEQLRQNVTMSINFLVSLLKKGW